MKNQKNYILSNDFLIVFFNVSGPEMERVSSKFMKNES